MNSNDPLKDVLTRTFPAREMSPELVRRVGHMRPHRTPRARWIALGSGLAAAGGLAAVVTLTGAPRMALADEILQEAKNRPGHELTYTIGPDGKPKLASESWSEPGRSRYIGYSPFPNDVLFDQADGYHVNWNGYNNSFRFGKLDPTPPERNAKSGAGDRAPDTLEGILSQPWVKKQKPTIGHGEFAGRRVDFVELTGPQGKYTVYADPDTHKTVGVRTQIMQADRSTAHWVHVGRGKHIEEGRKRVETVIMYDDAKPDPSIFEPIFTVNGVKIDAFKKRDEIEKRLSKPIATYSVGDLKIRDVSRNERGDVFLLYTGGTANNSYGSDLLPEALHDDVGGVYERSGGFRPYDSAGLGGSGRGDWPGYSFDGRVLMGFWYLHLAGKPTKGPVTIEFGHVTGRAPGVNHKQVPTEIAGLLPDYMPFMNLGLSPRSINDWSWGAFADYYTKTVHDYKKGEAYYRQVLAMPSFFPKMEDPWPHQSLAVCLEHEGKLREALAELRLAKKYALSDEDDENLTKWVAREVEPAIRRIEAKIGR